MDDTVGAIDAAVHAHPALSRRRIKVFAQGSYANRTNVRVESDVDVCIRCDDTLFYRVQADDPAVQAAVDRIGPATYKYPQFKNEVEVALVARFGRPAVHRGDKAFDIHVGAHRVDSDVIATFPYKLYYSLDRYGSPLAREGVQFITDKGATIFNFPQQHYDNGVAKNSRTHERFKAMVRVLKCLRNEMDEVGNPAARPVPSYLIECLVYNVPDETFGSSYSADLQNVIAIAWSATKTDDEAATWMEVDGIKFLFHRTQTWSREQAHAFLRAAYDHVGFGK